MEVAEGQSKNMASNVPVIPGHQGQSAVYRLLHWCSYSGVTILLWSILHTMSPSAEDWVVSDRVPSSYVYSFASGIPHW
jgi:hypothetical protein